MDTQTQLQNETATHRFWRPPKYNTIPEHELEEVMRLLKLFQIKGEPANEMLSEGQIEIFHALIFQPKNRVQIMTPTQYGKSLTVALACVVITCIQKKQIAVVAPSKEKARIIMRYYISHLGDNVLFENQLEADTKLERLKKEMSKERIDLRSGGGIFIVSTEGNSKHSVEKAMGYGSEYVILDEGCLIDDSTESTIYRMIGGHGDKGFYCKIGNPFYRTRPYTHFYKSWMGDGYYKIFVDWRRAIQEERFTREFIEEAKDKPNWGVLYEVKFPPADVVDDEGWMPLFTEEEIGSYMTSEYEIWGEPLLGCDVGGSGEDESVITLRGQNVAEIRFASADIEPMGFTGRIIVEKKKVDDELVRNVRDANVFVDEVGIGGEVVSRLREEKQACRAINAGNSPQDKNGYYNLRAEMFWKLRQWLSSGGRLSDDPRWYELANIKYKTDAKGRIKLMSKDKMRRDGIGSPNFADSLALTFAQQAIKTPAEEMGRKQEWFRRKLRRQQEKKNKKNKRFPR